MRPTSFMPLGIGSGSLIAGRYQIDRKLGAGGMSAVFTARDKALNNEECAVKILEPRLTKNPTDVDRFRNEVLITRKLTHPNIVRTYEFGQSPGGEYYVTMEYIPGRTLHDAIYDAQDPLTYGDILHYLREIAMGLSYAHVHGVIHRDLKPANILLSESGEVKITDFGLAQNKEIEIRLTQTGECVGTPGYMPPEQIQGKDVDARADIYALGILAYELVSGKLPYDAEDWYTLANQIITQPMPDLPQKRDKVPEWLSSFIAKAAAKRPEERFQTAAEIIEFLSPHAEAAGNSVCISHYALTERRMTAMRMSAAFDRKVYRFAPVIVCISLALLFLLIAVGASRESVKDMGERMDDGTTKLRDFAATVTDLVKAAVEVQKNKEVLKDFIDESKKQKLPSEGNQMPAPLQEFGPAPNPMSAKEPEAAPRAQAAP